MKDYIYLLGPNAGGICKIGKTINPTARYKAIRIDNWQDIKMLGLVRLPARTGYEVEHTLHQRFRSLKVKGEWFRDLGCVISGAFKSPDFGENVLSEWVCPKSLRKAPRTEFEKYLFDRNITQCGFAEMHGLSVITVHKYASGKVRPGYPRRREIALATDGAVPVTAWSDEAAA